MLSCPVRALRIYLDRTKEIRGTRRRLLLPIVQDKDKPRDIAANTVSSWIKNTVLKAYSSSGQFLHDDHVRRLYNVGDQEAADLNRAAHEVRAQSASYKFDSTNQSLSTIMRACYWRSPTVFTDFYLRDISMEDREHLLRLSSRVLQGDKDAPPPTL